MSEPTDTTVEHMTRTLHDHVGPRTDVNDFPRELRGLRLVASKARQYAAACLLVFATIRNPMLLLEAAECYRRIRDRQSLSVALGFLHMVRMDTMGWEKLDPWTFRVRDLTVFHQAWVFDVLGKYVDAAELFKDMRLLAHEHGDRFAEIQNAFFEARARLYATICEDGAMGDLSIRGLLRTLEGVEAIEPKDAAEAKLKLHRAANIKQVILTARLIMDEWGEPCDTRVAEVQSAIDSSDATINPRIWHFILAGQALANEDIDQASSLLLDSAENSPCHESNTDVESRCAGLLLLARVLSAKKMQTEARATLQQLQTENEGLGGVIFRCVGKRMLSELLAEAS